MSKFDTAPNGMETLRQSIDLKLSRDYGSVYYDRLVVVDPKLTRIAIDDISQQDPSIAADIEWLMLACKGEIEVYDAAKLAIGLGQRLSRFFDVVNRKTTAAIFPGTGAQTVKNNLPAELFTELGAVINLSTQRRVNPQTKAVEGVTILNSTEGRKALDKTKIENIVVIEDAIVTGSTLDTLRCVFPTRNIKWDAASLFSLSPMQRRGTIKNADSGIFGYDNVISPIVYQGTSGIPALNSLSTLVGTTEKSKMVRERYIRDFVEDPEIFLDAVISIQRKLKL